jgi:hypothetical protein
VQSSRLAGRMGPLAVLVATSMTANAADVASAAQGAVVIKQIGGR